jgi:diaminopimelate epimerase
MTPFWKIQGIGNDFVVLDLLPPQAESTKDKLCSAPPADLNALAKRVCDRHFGVGADGLIVVSPGSQSPYSMRMFNPDGSESEMCGNGLRCVGRLLKENGYYLGGHTEVETGAGTLTLEIVEDQFRINMGKPRFERGQIGMIGPVDQHFTNEEVAPGWKGTAVSMGNPHLVIFTEDVASIDLALIGPELEKNPLFTNRTNVHFVQRLSSNRLRQRTWERGAGATLACGTGACAVGVVAITLGETEREVEIELPGGALKIEYKLGQDVWMTGPAEIVFTGQID